MYFLRPETLQTSTGKLQYLPFEDLFFITFLAKKRVQLSGEVTEPKYAEKMPSIKCKAVLKIPTQIENGLKKCKSGVRITVRSFDSDFSGKGS